MNGPGFGLKQARIKNGLTYRDVENASEAIAAARHNPEYFVPISRLSEIENHGALPTIYRVFTLCSIYRLSFLEILRWYGIDLSELPGVPAQIGPATVALRTELLAPEDVPASMVAWVTPQAGSLVRYARIGSEDRIMDPLIPPGALVQVDARRRQVREWAWRNEFERPVYLIEHKDGITCCWCSVHHRTLVLQPHPLSPCSPRVYRYPQQAEVTGLVTGVARPTAVTPFPRPATTPEESADR